MTASEADAAARNAAARLKPALWLCFCGQFNPVSQSWCMGCGVDRDR